MLFEFNQALTSKTLIFITFEAYENAIYDD